MTAAIKDGDIIRVHYQGRFAGGEVFDDSTTRTPFTFVVGTAPLLKGFDQAVIGMVAGERKTVSLPPEQAFGVHREDLVFSLPRNRFPAPLELRVGLQLKLPLQGGQVVTARVVEVDENTVRLDANHPLSGRIIEYDIEVLATGLKPTDLFAAPDPA
ncbi:peptidylprolyl isomerase [Desulfuromonas sp. CSMB_57]|jgi:peptidylprolyl isomerase|uniref:FKBP-type peptidyl-prolyl cis-trans isomerase n=1 Tax=Desulfuromonas sp. CSMB_57 TaxID=2807629 RepID=UPI001CD627CC|nr:peptidylprolyl isomerase [Desulfuromonas sp. CSMB_57]